MTFYRFAHLFLVAFAPLLLWISYQFSLWMWTKWIVVSSIQHWMKEYLLTSIPNMAKCLICESNVLSHSKVKCCSVCKMEYHFNCISLNREERGRLNQATKWYCPPNVSNKFSHSIILLRKVNYYQPYLRQSMIFILLIIVMQILTCPLIFLKETAICLYMRETRILTFIWEYIPVLGIIVNITCKMTLMAWFKVSI